MMTSILFLGDQKQPKKYSVVFEIFPKRMFFHRKVAQFLIGKISFFKTFSDDVFTLLGGPKTIKKKY